MTNRTVYEKRREDIHKALNLVLRQLSSIEANALKGNYPLGEFGEALKHIVCAAGSLGVNTEEFREIAKRNGIEW